VTNFTPSIRFAYSRCKKFTKKIRLNSIGIGGTTVYFLNRQGGSNSQDEFSNNLALSIQKVNYMHQSIGGVITDRDIFSPLYIFVKTTPFN
jgi:hypothetical protein